MVFHEMYVDFLNFQSANVDYSVYGAPHTINLIFDVILLAIVKN